VLVSELEVSTDKLLAAGVQILELPESTTPEEMLHTAALGFEMTNRLDMLTRREKRIIEMCYGLNGKEELEMTEIGTLLNLTRSRVQQLRDQALRKIRANSSRIVAEIRDSGL
jgi:RNA polymerase primary sigma factor